MLSEGSSIVKFQRSLFIFTTAVGLIIGFWFYGVGRTMRETVHFNLTAVSSGMLLGMILPLAAILPLLIVKRLWFRDTTWAASSLFISLLVSLFIGCFLSEAWMLRDETRFTVEASKVDSIYSRPRAWPNQTCSLVFIPGKGIHSTD